MYIVDILMQKSAYLVQLRQRTLILCMAMKFFRFGLLDHSKVDTRARAQTSTVLVATTSSFASNPFLLLGVSNPRKKKWYTPSKLASFDFRTRVWRRLDLREPPGTAKGRTPPPTAMATVPAPRAYHVAWAFGDDVYVHGGEGPTLSRTDTDDPDLDGVFWSVGRDLFAEEDGGAPLDPGRVVRGAGAGKGAAASGHRVRNTGPSCGAERRPCVSVLEDLWKLDFRTLRWERVRAWVSHSSF